MLKASVCSILTALICAPLAGLQAEPLEKEALHEEMRGLESRIAELKASPSAEARGQVVSVQDELDAISRVLGGDLPCAIGPAEASRASAKGGGASVPTGCSSTTATFTQAAPTAVPSGPAVVTSTLNVSGAGSYLWDVNVTTFLPHTFAADLDITITSPAGTVVTLTSDNGAGNDNVFNGTVWDDSANPSGQVPYTTNNGLVTDHAYVNLTLASPLVPEEALHAFVGEDPNGTWTITISDDTAGDAGSLDSWSLDVTTFDAVPIMDAPVSFDQTTPVAIPTGPGVVTSDLAVSGLTNAICDVELRTSITHTFNADMDITLTSPSGRVVTLTTDNGAGNDNVLNGTLWDDYGNPAGQVPYTTNNGLATDHAYVNLTLASPLVAEESLGAFLGESGNGTWTITVSDDLAGDGGSIDAWGLDITTCSCEPQADLMITKDDGVASVTPGGSVVYTITASNAGPSDAASATVADTFPAALTCTWACVGAGGGTCTAGGSGNINDFVNLPAGGSTTYTATCDIDPAASGTLDNTATVSSAITDPVPGNNSATDSDSYAPVAELILGKVASVANVAPGDAVGFLVTISNAGPSSVADALLTDTVPAGLTCSWTAIYNDGASGAAAGSGNIAETLDLPVGSSAVVGLDCTVANDAPSGIITNTAVVNSASSSDPTPANNTASADVTVVGGALLSATKAISAHMGYVPGSSVTYTVVLQNNGVRLQQDNAGDEFTDVLPAGLTLVSATASSGTATASVGTNTVTWNGSIAAGGSVSIDIVASMDADATGDIANQGSVSFDADGDDANDTSGATDDPATPASGDATVFGVITVPPAIAGPALIPATDGRTLALLVLLFAGIAGLLLLRRKI